MAKYPVCKGYAVCYWHWFTVDMKPLTCAQQHSNVFSRENMNKENVMYGSFLQLLFTELLIITKLTKLNQIKKKTVSLQ